MESYYITTPIYYVSGKPHLGHAYTTIASDILARWNRNAGRKVFFLTGTDEHGQKVEKKAREQGMEPKEFVDSLIHEFTGMNEHFNISHDYFIRTTYEEHKNFVQEMLQKAYDKGDIYKDTYKGLYCVDCEKYYTEQDLEENNCPIHRKPVEQMDEENYFFKLSKYQDELLKFYEEKPGFLSPSTMRQETINRVQEGLQDISISRNKKTLSWGVELPFDKDHVTYVWFDALFNYLSALRINNAEEFWPAQVHVVGKDIMWFHKVYWPAFLLSVGKELPEKVYAHGWWTVEGEKMGKALGNVIDPIEFSSKYGVDEFRYFILTAGTFGEDQDFSFDRFKEKVNSELNDDLGNLASRIYGMTNKYFDGRIPEGKEFYEKELELVKASNIYKDFDKAMDELDFTKAVDLLWGFIRKVNSYINEVEPWREKDKERLATTMNILISSLKLISGYIEPLMPDKAKKLRVMYNFNQPHFELKLVDSGGLGEKDRLFEKID